MKGITRRRLINQSTNQSVASFEGNNNMLDISGDWEQEITYRSVRGLEKCEAQSNNATEQNKQKNLQGLKVSSIQKLTLLLLLIMKKRIKTRGKRSN